MGRIALVRISTFLIVQLYLKRVNLQYNNEKVNVTYGHFRCSLGHSVVVLNAIFIMHFIKCPVSSRTHTGHLQFILANFLTKHIKSLVDLAVYTVPILYPMIEIQFLYLCVCLLRVITTL